MPTQCGQRELYLDHLPASVIQKRNARSHYLEPIFVRSFIG